MSLGRMTFATVLVSHDVFEETPDDSEEHIAPFFQMNKKFWEELIVCFLFTTY
jgi:hypothetical protein